MYYFQQLPFAISTKFINRPPKISPTNCIHQMDHSRFILMTVPIIYHFRIERGLKKESIIEFLENLAKLITPEYIDALYLKTYQFLEEMGYTTDKLMLELMQPCNNMIKNCAWLGKIVPCETLFRVARSSEGFCCSFNYKALKGDLEMLVYNRFQHTQLFPNFEKSIRFHFLK